MSAQPIELDMWDRTKRGEHFATVAKRRLEYTAASLASLEDARNRKAGLDTGRTAAVIVAEQQSAQETARQRRGCAEAKACARIPTVQLERGIVAKLEASVVYAIRKMEQIGADGAMIQPLRTVLEELQTARLEDLS